MKDYTALLASVSNFEILESLVTSDSLDILNALMLHFLSTDPLFKI